MNESKISVRYAKALLSIAIEKDILDKLKDDMTLVHNICKNNSEFISMIESPVIKTSQKWSVIKQLFESVIHEHCLGFLELIFINKREIFIEAICRVFLDLYREHKGIKNVFISSVIPLDNEIKTRITEVLKNAYNSEIVLEEIVNKKLIGGFILRIEDQQIDASILTQLKRVKRELIGSDYKKNY